MSENKLASSSYLHAGVSSEEFVFSKLIAKDTVERRYNEPHMIDVKVHCYSGICFREARLYFELLLITFTGNYFELPNWYFELLSNVNFLRQKLRCG